MRIAVVGSGYVGLVAGACFADMGHDVILVDNDQQKLAALQSGQCPIHEQFLPELLARHRGGNACSFPTICMRPCAASAAIFIAVGTPPTDNGDADLSYVESVAREISGAINGYKIVVEKSTVPVYTSDWVRKIILRNGAAGGRFRCGVKSGISARRHGGDRFPFSGPHRGGSRYRTMRRRPAGDLCPS